MRNIIKEIADKYRTNPMQERIAVAAAISEEANKIGNYLVVAGGSAVEFYTAASYMTKDLDFVAKDGYRLAEIMRKLGFSITAGYSWVHPDTSVIVEFPTASENDVLEGDYDKVMEVETEYGVANIIGIEDAIIDRLCGRKFWGDSNDTPEQMIYGHYDEIDFVYLRKQAKYQLIEKELDVALQKVEKVRKKSR